MTRPNFVAYIFGNPLAQWGTIGALIFLILRAFLGDLQAIPLAISAFAASRCWKFAGELTAYRIWKRQLDNMSDPKANSNFITRMPRLRAAVAIGVWVGISQVGLTYMSDANRTWAEDWVLFCNVVICAFVATKVAVWMARRLRPAAKPFTVTGCARKAISSPDFRKTYALLPEYCLRLLPHRLEKGA